MILIVKQKTNEIIGADKDFLKSNSIEELNQKFSDNIDNLDKLKNETEYANYKIESIPIKDYKILFFLKEAKLNNNINDDIKINIDHLLNKPLLDNSSNKQSIDTSDKQPILELDNIISTEKQNLQINQNIDNNNNDIKINIDHLLNEPLLDNSSNKQSIDTSDKQPILELDNIIPSDKQNLQINQNIDNDISPINSIKFNDKKEKKPIVNINFDVESIKLKKEKNNNTKDKRLNIKLSLGVNNLEQKKDNLLDKKIEEIKKIINNELQIGSKELNIDDQTIQKFFKKFIEQLKNEKTIIYNALNKKDYKILHESFHKLKGILLNLRVNQLGKIFTNLDNMAIQNKNIHKIEESVNKIYKIFDTFFKNEEKLKINTNISKKDLKIKLISLNEVLNELKNENLEKIKLTINSIYEKFPLLELKEIIESKNIYEIKEKIKKLQDIINKEIL